MADFTEIIEEINTNLPDNNTQAITAEKLRETLIDLTETIESQQDSFEEGVETTLGQYNKFATNQDLGDVSIVDDLTTGGANDVLSAEQGKVLNDGKIDKVEIETSYISIEGSFLNGYIKASGVTSSTSSRVFSFPVTQGKVYRISGKYHSTQTSYLYAYYNGNSFVSSHEVSTEETKGTVKTIEVTVPTDDVTIDTIKIEAMTVSSVQYTATCEEKILSTNNNIQKLNSVGDTTQLETTDKSTLVAAINEVHGDIGTLEEKFNGITEIEQPQYVNLFNNASSNILTGYYLSPISSDGKLTSGVDNYKMSKPIPVISGHYYYIWGRTGNVMAIRCLAEGATATNSNGIKVIIAGSNNDETFSSWDLPLEDGSSYTMNGQFKVPANADYVQFSLTINSGGNMVGNIDNVMLLHVGDTYNPNYVPPTEYIPYSDTPQTKTVVKEEALPNELMERLDTMQEEINNISPQQTKLKVLLIGSSHGLNTSTQFPWIAYNSGIDILFGNVYDGSMSMQNVVGRIMHNRGNMLRVFENGAWTEAGVKYYSDIFSYTDWDVISIQRGAGTDSVWFTTDNELDEYLEQHAGDPVIGTMKLELNINRYETDAEPVYMNHNQAMQYLLDVIRNNATANPTVIMNSGFADSNAYNTTSLVNQTTSINETADEMVKQFGVHFMPVSTGVMNARNTFMRYFGVYDNPNNHLPWLAYDGQHLDFGIGCYVAGVTFLEFILRLQGKSVISLKGYGSATEVKSFLDLIISGMYQNNRYTEPTDETMMVAKACAMCACDDTTPSTQLSNRFKWKITTNLSNGITSSNTKGYCANNERYVTTLTGTINNLSITSRVWDSTQSPTTLVENTDYTFVDGVLTINSVDGDIVITAS